MALFSHRKGLKQLKKEFQFKSLDEESRNRIWSLLNVFVWNKWIWDWNTDTEARSVEILLGRIWFSYFKKANDTRPKLFGELYGRGGKAYDELRSYFFICDWFEVYDFVEFIVNQLPQSMTLEFTIALNIVLTEENIAFRIVDKQFTDITNETELVEIEDAAKTRFDGVNKHITDAIAFLSDRKSPNYRNSIKESISAVESLFKCLTGKNKITFKDGMSNIEKKFEIHPALKEGFEKIYAYTSDDEGIRHGMVESPNCSYNEAKFMLVSCSAFINYVIGKSSES